MPRGARLDQLTELYHQSGPFATAYVEVSRDAESGNQVAELAAREAADAAREFQVRAADHPGLVLGASIGDEPVRADLAVVAAACLTDAEVVISRASTLGGAPVAALLRWDQTAQGTRA